MMLTTTAHPVQSSDVRMQVDVSVVQLSEVSISGMRFIEFMVIEYPWMLDD